MTRDILKRYDALKDEQRDVKRRADQIARDMERLMNEQVADTVKGTRRDGTYGTITIKGFPQSEYDQKREQLNNRLNRYEEIDRELESMIEGIEEFINKVDEPQIRTIMRLKYIDGLSWRSVGHRYGRGSSWAFSKVEKYLRKKSTAKARRRKKYAAQENNGSKN